MPYDAEQSWIRSVLCLPNLQTLWLQRKEDGAVDDLVQHNLCSGIGNIREFRLFWSHTGASPFMGWIPVVWNTELVAHNGQRLGRIKRLQLTGIKGSLAISLQKWARHTEFGQLRVLSLETTVTRAALEALIKLPLQSLHSLGLNLASDTRQDESAALKTFICSFSGLSHLRLTGAVPSSALEPILRHLDPTLQTLYLIPASNDLCRLTFDSSTITLVTDGCKNVRDLGISMRRAWNKPGQDIAVLKAIGRMPQLSHLDLTFDAVDHAALIHSSDVDEAANLAPSDPSFSAYDQELFHTPFWRKQLRKGHVRDALINSAIDADLARAVFNTILSATLEGETPSLQHLYLKAEGGGSFGTSTINVTIMKIADEVGREWIVERAGHGEVEVRRMKVDTEGFELSDCLGWDVEPIFRNIWPGDGDWFNEWRAFPLLQ